MLEAKPQQVLIGIAAMQSLVILIKEREIAEVGIYY
jgi:hypothetical protein